MAAQGEVDADLLNIPDTNMVNLNAPSNTQVSNLDIPQGSTVSRAGQEESDVEAQADVPAYANIPEESEVSLEEDESELYQDVEGYTSEEIYGERTTSEFFSEEEKIEGEQKEEKEDKNFTYMEFTETNEDGEVIQVKKQVKMLKEESSIVKKMVPITVKFNRLTDKDEVVEEEEIVEEEMTFKIIKQTVLIKETNQKGEKVMVEKVIEKEFPIEEKHKPTKTVTVMRKDSKGEEYEEEVDVTDDEVKSAASPTLSGSTISDLTISDIRSIYGTEAVEEEEEMKPKLPSTELIEGEERIFKVQILKEMKVVTEKLKTVMEKNQYLGRKLCEYYKLKKDKEGHFLKYTPEQEEILEKQYHKRLLEYAELRKFVIDERSKKKKILRNAKMETIALKKHLNEKIENFFDKLREMVKKFDPRACKLSLRHVDFEKLIDQLHSSDKVLSEMRLKYLTTMGEYTDLKKKMELRERNRAANREEDDEIDIIEFENVKKENENVNDELEHKENMMIEFKDKLAHAVQTLAHIRFKNEAIDASLHEIKKSIVTKRKIVIVTKKECVWYRRHRIKMMEKLKRIHKKEGLLKYPRLVGDYFHLLQEKKALLAKLVQAKKIASNQRIVVQEMKKKAKQKKNKQKKPGSNISLAKKISDDEFL